MLQHANIIFVQPKLSRLELHKPLRLTTWITHLIKMHFFVYVFYWTFDATLKINLSIKLVFKIHKVY